MYTVVLDLAQYVVLDRVETSQQAETLMVKVQRDLQDRGYYVDTCPIYPGELDVYSRIGDDLSFLGCLYYLEDKD